MANNCLHRNRHSAICNGKNPHFASYCMSCIIFRSFSTILTQASYHYCRNTRALCIRPTVSSYILKQNYLTLPSIMKRAKKERIDDLASESKRSHSSSVEDDTKTIDFRFGLGQRQPINEADFKDFLLDIKQKKEECGSSIEDYDYDERRSRCINGIAAKPEGDYRSVSFWMFRDQRIDDNWALVCAQKFALKHKCPLYVTFFLMSHYSVAGLRQYDFMLKGLQQVENQCKKLGIQFHLELGYAKNLIVDYCQQYEIDLVIADFCPLRDPLSWVEEAGKKLKKINVPLYQVDAHNIIPCWITSEKLEFAARTIRPKVHRVLNEFLTEIPAIEPHPYAPNIKNESDTDWKKAWDHLKIDETVLPVTWAQPGTLAAYRMLYEFMSQRLKGYADDRNDPCKHGLSCLSPYYHFGQLSVQRVILSITDRAVKSKCSKSVDAYVEECVVRRELSDNYCFYQPDYDNYNGAWAWAKKTIEKHRSDKRERIYTFKEFQFAKTHDKLWNACQIQLLREGKMHGYMRMYWAKKIYEWTESVEDALEYAIKLNDKYELDGRDPNGYVGIMWSMCGVHDRAWFERPVFGQIRYMVYNGCARKFDVEKYARLYNTVP